ncbi:unnamed protein product [Lymnaea stagnalis]|uniref:Inner centromere protein ARK-binding domain-containing protein n=1 Tax=Lymnaea stagnalis TaxID=6523 RepID=A0AAV2ILK9_LYMST
MIPAKGRHSEIESYDIADKNSDDSTDDEDAPRKTIPKWCLGICENIMKAIMIQESSQVDPDIIFQANRIVPPDLRLIFPRKKKFKERTSSALWTSPVLKVTSFVE